MDGGVHCSAVLFTGKNRAGEIRTRDLLNPIQAHYQAVLRPEVRTIRRSTCGCQMFLRSVSMRMNRVE